MTKIRTDRVQPNPEQPRVTFDAGELQGLAESIKAVGLVQPIVVERAAGGKYILVDGERRWRAVKLLKQQTIEAVIREHSNHSGQGRRMAALVANVQRADLSPIEQARGFAALYQELGSKNAVCRKLGISGQVVEYRLKLLDFPEPVRNLFDRGRLPLMNQVIDGAQKLPAAEQTRVLTTGAARGWGGHALVKAIAVAAKRTHTKLEQPTRSKKEREIDLAPGAHFDALALVARWKDLPPMMVEQARKTCQACDLYAEAGEPICKRCPLPDFLSRCRLSITSKEA